MARLGFVGTGTMGTPIAAHLVKASHYVTVFDRSPDAVRSVVEAGATSASSAADAAADTACVFLSLPVPTDVEEAVTGVLDADPRPEWIVDLSTNSPRMVRRLHERCAAVGVVFVDAPVSGGRVKAETGELSVLVGASGEDFTAVEPLLRCFAREIFHVGPCGTGTVAKLVNNQIFLAAGVLVQEAYVLAAAAGLEPSALHQIIKASSAGPYAALAPLLLGRSFDDVIFRLDIATEDLSLAVEAARDHGAPATMAAAALSVYRDAMDAGLGTEVFHATLKQIEQAAGIELPPLTRRSKPS